MTENWKDVAGYEGRYQVSDHGRVRNVKSERTLKASEKRTGYMAVTLSADNRPRSASVHRLVALAFLANPENKPQVNHKNGDKTDNRAENLEWSTRSENQKHRFDILGHTGNTARPVLCKETGKVYPSAKAAAQDLGLCRPSISRCCAGKANHTNHLHFNFLEE